MKKGLRGGRRDGSGRPKSPYKTVTVSFRVRAEWVETIKSTVKHTVTNLSIPLPPSESPESTCSNDTDQSETMRNSCKIAHRTP